MTTFKKGDRVRSLITCNTGTVTDVECDGIVWAKWDQSGDLLWASAKNLELVTDTADKWRAFSRLGEAMHRITQASCGADAATIASIAREIEVIADRLEAPKPVASFDGYEIGAECEVDTLGNGWVRGTVVSHRVYKGVPTVDVEVAGFDYPWSRNVGEAALRKVPK